MFAKEPATFAPGVAQALATASNAAVADERPASEKQVAYAVALADASGDTDLTEEYVRGLSMTEVSAVIEALKAQVPQEMATEPQKRKLTELMAEVDGGDTLPLDVAELTKKQASAEISRLLKAKKRSFADIDPALPVTEQVFSVVDVETSGFDEKKSHVVQVAVVRVKGSGEIVDVWSSLVRPPASEDGSYDVGPTNIHGITPEMVETAPTFQEIAADVAGRFDGTIVAAHNAQFDWKHLRSEFRRAQDAAGDDRPWSCPDDAALLCTLEMSRRLYEKPVDVQNHKLGTMCDAHGISLENAHNAEDDAVATAELVPFLIGRAGIERVGQLTAYEAGGRTRWVVPPAQ